MTTFNRSFYYLMVLTDIVILTLSYFISLFVINNSIYSVVTPKILYVILLINILWFSLTGVTGLYTDFRSRNYAFELFALLRTIFFLTMVIIVFFFLIGEDYLGRRFIFSFIPLIFVLISIKRYFVRKYLQKLRLRGKNIRTIMLIGSGEAAKAFCDTIEGTPQYGYSIAGYLDNEVNENQKIPYLGKISDLNMILTNRKIDDVIIALPQNVNGLIKEIITICEQHTIRVKIIPDYFQVVSEKYSVSMFGSLPVISVREDKLNEFQWRLLKRVFDTVFTSLIFIFVLWWLIPLLALALKISSEGPVFFKQERWGRDNKKFFTYKFRSMEVGSETADADGKYKQAVKEEPRVTKLGRFLRKSNLDELPQFYNVIKGEMSVVGPRPHPTPLNLESKDKIHNYMLRHLVQPGITGWAQVHGFRGSTKDPKLMQKRIDHDIWYIENWTFFLDLQIILLTIWKMFRGDPNAY